MSISSRIWEMNNHLLADYEVLTLAGADLTNVDKNIVNLKMSWKERLLYFMNNGTDIVWNNWNKVSGTGTTLSLNNTEEAPMSLTYKGNTQQSGTPTPSSPIPVQVVSGDNSIEVVGKNLVKSKHISDSTSQFSGVLNIEADLNPNTTYTISFNGTNGNSIYLNERLFTYKTLNIGTERAVIQATTLSNISKSDAAQYTNGYGWVIFKNNKNQDNPNVFDNLQLEKGNQATTYEEYKGASYPITLPEGMFLGWIPNTTYQDKIDKSTGKNLWNEQWELGNINITTGALEPASNYVRPKDYIKVKPNTTYYRTPSYEGRIFFYQNNKTYIDNVFITSSGGTFTTPSNCDYILLKYYGTTYKNDIAIYEGSTSLPYEPYGTGWYLKKEIGKVVLDGSESGWGGQNGSVGYYYYLTINDIKLNTGGGVNGLLYSNYFVPITPNQSWASDVIGATVHQTNRFLIIKYDTDDTDTLAKWKTWLTTHNTTVYYVLSTPTYEYITDTTLLSQLEALKKSYDSQTNISQTNNDLPFELSVTALEVMS